MIDQDLQNAYEKAIYRIFFPAISWKIGDKNSHLDDLLETHQVKSACFITAHNPRSIRLSTSENRERQNKLYQLIQDRRWSCLEGQGEDKTGHWPDEPSYLIFGISAEQGVEIATQFEQNAIVFLSIGEAARLVICSDQI